MEVNEYVENVNLKSVFFCCYQYTSKIEAGEKKTHNLYTQSPAFVYENTLEALN